MCLSSHPLMCCLPCGLPSHTFVGTGNMTSIGQWDASKHETSKSLMITCTLGLAFPSSIPCWNLAAMRVEAQTIWRGHMEENGGSGPQPQLSSQLAASTNLPTTWTSPLECGSFSHSGAPTPSWHCMKWRWIFSTHLCVDGRIVSKGMIAVVLSH